MAVEIIPAVMPASFDDLKAKLLQVKEFVDTVQIDVMDGLFVPEKSWPYTPGGPQEFGRIVSERESFPFWDVLDFEVDLMVHEPEVIVAEWIRAGVKRVIVHIESTESFSAIVSSLREKFSHGHEFDVEVVELGIALNTTTENERIEAYLDSVDFVQFMGIEKIGYQGQVFDKRVLEKIKALRKTRQDIIISVDGGVSLKTAPKLIEAGANRLAVGSAIFESENVRETIGKFKSLPS